MEESEEAPSLTVWARAGGASRSHFHRLFKAATGLTPKDYAAAHRATRVRENLARGGSVTEAIYDAGFNASSRFYEKSRNMLGMTPSRYRSGGADAQIPFALRTTSRWRCPVAGSCAMAARSPAAPGAASASAP